MATLSRDILSGHNIRNQAIFLLFEFKGPFAMMPAIKSMATTPCRKGENASLKIAQPFATPRLRKETTLMHVADETAVIASIRERIEEVIKEYIEEDEDFNISCNLKRINGKTAIEWHLYIPERAISADSHQSLRDAMSHLLDAQVPASSQLQILHLQ